MLDIILHPTESHDLHYFIEIYSPIVIGLIAALIAYFANEISKRAMAEQAKQFQEQLKLERNNFQKQFELQKIQWKYDNFFKYKQEKLLELRNLYRLFKRDLEIFLFTFLPSGIGSNEGIFKLPDMSNIWDDSKVKVLYTTTEYNEAPSSIMNQFLINSKNLYDFLLTNDIFIQDNPVLYSDLKSISKGFKELYSALIDNKGFDKLFIEQDNKFIPYPENKSFRKFFYTFMHYRMGIMRGDLNTSLFYEIPNSIFKLYKMDYSDENIEKWSSNNIILFHTGGIFVTWLETWEKYINDFFVTSLNEISNIYSCTDSDTRNKESEQ